MKNTFTNPALMLSEYLGLTAPVTRCRGVGEIEIFNPVIRKGLLARVSL